MIQEIKTTVINIKACSACGQDHDNIQTVEAVNPVREVGEQKKPRRFYYCPNTAEQVWVEKEAKDAQSD